MRMKKIKLGLITVMMGLCLFQSPIYADDGGEVERNFSIDVAVPTVEKTDNDINKPKGNLNDTFEVEVKKRPVEIKKDTSPKRRNVRKNNYEPTKPTKARGTVTENVGADNRKFPIREKIEDKVSQRENASDRPKADKR